MEHLKKWLSVVLGLALLIVGLVPLLNAYNVISFSIPSFLGTFISVLLAFGGFYLVIDAFLGFSGMNEMKLQGMLGLIIGIVVCFMGAIPLLTSFGVDVAFAQTIFTYGLVAANYFYAVAGLLLVIYGFRLD